MSRGQVEVEFSALNFLFTLLVFLTWILAVWGAGSTIRVNFFARIPRALDLSIGSLVAVAITVCFGHLGLIGPKFQWLWWIFIASGLGFFFLEIAKLDFYKIFARIPREDYAWWAFGVFYFLTRAIAASNPQGHGDPLLYHLLGPRLWVEQGRIGLTENLPTAMLANYWEYLYVWPQQIFYQGLPSQGLIAAQIFSQWTHLFLAQAGSLFLFHSYLRIFFISSRWVTPVALGSIMAADLAWTGGIAKNDWAVVFWSLSGLVVIEAARRDNHRRLASLAIFFWGMALVAKFNGVLVVIPALVFYGVYFVARKDRRRLGIFIVFAGPLILLFSSLPLVARNYFETGNPFYPMMNRIFASPWVSASFAVLIENVEPVRSPFLETLFRRLVEFSKQGAIFFIALPGIFFAGAKLYRQRTVRAQPIIFLGLFSFLTYVIAGNASQDIRYLGLGLLLLGGVGAMFLLEELSLWTPKKFTLYISIGLFIAIAATSKLPLHLYRKLATQAWGADAILLHTAGQAKAWIRTHAGPDDLTIMVADNEAYYLSGAKTTILTERPDIDAATRRASNLEEFLRGICWNARDAKFLLDARPEMGLVHLFPVSKARLDLSTVFSSSSGRVVSIEKLVGLSQDPETKAACPHLKAGSP